MTNKNLPIKIIISLKLGSTFHAVKHKLIVSESGHYFSSRYQTRLKMFAIFFACRTTVRNIPCNNQIQILEPTKTALIWFGILVFLGVALKSLDGKSVMESNL